MSLENRSNIDGIELRRCCNFKFEFLRLQNGQEIQALGAYLPGFSRDRHEKAMNNRSGHIIIWRSFLWFYLVWITPIWVSSWNGGWLEVGAASECQHSQWWRAKLCCKNDSIHRYWCCSIYLSLRRASKRLHYFCFTAALSKHEVF